MARLGMDDTVVEQAGRDLKTQASDIGNTIGQIDRVVSQISGAWDGQDSQTFCQTTWPNFKRQLQQMQTSIDQLGDTALRNVQAQRDTSSRS